MSEVALITCCKKKATTAPDGRRPAEQLYQGNLFKAQLRYARYSLGLFDDRIFILSAKFGLVRLWDELPSYNQMLGEMTVQERMEWGQGVTRKLLQVDLGITTAHVLAGRLYREPLAQPFEKVGIEIAVPHPEGLGYGQQVAWYKG